jgi:hypothetical protein
MDRFFYCAVAMLFDVGIKKSSRNGARQHRPSPFSIPSSSSPLGRTSQKQAIIRARFALAKSSEANFQVSTFGLTGV